MNINNTASGNKYAVSKRRMVAGEQAMIDNASRRYDEMTQSQPSKASRLVKFALATLAGLVIWVILVVAFVTMRGM